MQGREREYLGWFYREFCWQRGAITQADIDEYLRCYSQPGALRAGFEYYRALPRDKADNQSAARFRIPAADAGARAGRGEGGGARARRGAASSLCARSRRTFAAGRFPSADTSFPRSSRRCSPSGCSTSSRN